MKPPSFQRDESVLLSMPSLGSKWGPEMSIKETPVAPDVTQSMEITMRRKDFEEAGSVSLISAKRSKKTPAIFLLAFVLIVAGVASYMLRNTSDSEEELNGPKQQPTPNTPEHGDEELLVPTQQPTTIIALSTELCAVVESQASSVFFCASPGVSTRCDVESGVIENLILCSSMLRTCDCEPGQFSEFVCSASSKCQDIN